MATDPQALQQFTDELDQLIKRYKDSIAADYLLEEEIEHLRRLLDTALQQNTDALHSLRVAKLFDDMVRLSAEDGWDTQRMLEESPTVSEEIEERCSEYYELSRRLVKLKERYLKD